MTVSVPLKLEFSSNGDGVSTSFSYPVRFLEKSEIVVVLRDADDVDTVQTLNTDYTIAGSSWPSGGNVVFSVAPPVGVKVIRYRQTQAKQVVDLENNGPNNANSVEQQLDRLAMVDQDNKRGISDLFQRSVKFPRGYAGDTAIEAPAPGKMLGWNADGTKIVNKEIVTPGSIVAGAAGIQVLQKDTTQEIRDYLDTPVYVPTRTELKALDPTKDKVAETWNDGARNGSFSSKLISGLTAAEVTQRTADTFEAIYVTSTQNPLYVWKRLYTGGIDVLWSGAAKDASIDASAAFQASVNMLPAVGGEIIVPDGSYLLTTEPLWGARNIYWNMGLSVVFSGAAIAFHGFPYCRSNYGHRAVGPFIQSQSAENTAANGGISALTVEMIQPAEDVARQSVAIYGGAVGTSPNPEANVWAANFLVAAEWGARGVYQGIEVDVNVVEPLATTKGVSISGGGTVNADVGLEITRAANSWDRGIHILNSSDSIVVHPDVAGRGVVVRSNTSDVAPSIGAAISIRQNGAVTDTLLLQRHTDAAPTGHLIRAVDAANSANIFQIDVLGNINTIGLVSSSGNVCRGVTPTAGPGEVAFGASTSPSAPISLNPNGFIVVSVGGTNRLVPYF